MAKQAKTAEVGELPTAGYITETLTYLPGPMDPPTVVRNGHTFHANVPKEVTGHPEGTKHERINMEIIDSCRNNKFYAVGEYSGPSRRKEAASVPETSDQYRAYMVEWMKNPSIQHADQLIARFVRDRELQLACEVGSDDYSYLSTLFMPKLHDMARADELTEGQIASLWISHGVNQLPW